MRLLRKVNLLCQTAFAVVIRGYLRKPLDEMTRTSQDQVLAGYVQLQPTGLQPSVHHASLYTACSIHQVQTANISSTSLLQCQDSQVQRADWVKGEPASYAPE